MKFGEFFLKKFFQSSVRFSEGNDYTFAENAINCYPLTPTTPYPPDPHHPLAEFCVQFWSLFHGQDHLVLSLTDKK